ncbi:uncharacterized protein LOC105827915 isoform X2 [Monomorium pharaonis]|nr:uncharacterized protein LOC105827915 isoform X2 [Monomorium pharaonis]
MPKLRITMNETHSRPHFACHTQSSLMKTRTPKKLKKNNSSLTKDMSEPKKLQGNIISRLNGVHKRRSNIIKQSKSMQMLIMILKQQRDRRIIDLSSSGNSKLAETSCLLESSLVSLPTDLIKDISCDLKRCTGSPAKSVTLCAKEQTKVVNKSEKSIEEDSHDSSQDGLNCAERNNSRDTLNFAEDNATANIACKLELHLSNEEKKSADSRREVEIHNQIKSNRSPSPSSRFYYRTESEEKHNDFPNKTYSEAQTRPESVNATTTKRKYKVWQKNKKAWTRNEYVDNRQNNWTANERSVVNTNATTWKRDAFQKNLVFNQRAWRPPGIVKTRITESLTSLQSLSQKSSLSGGKSIASTKSKRSSIEDIDESTSASVSTNQTTALMKENRDPRANRMTKISEHLTETKQRQRLQGGGTFPKKKRSKTKINPKVLERDDAKFPIPKSKSRHSQTQPIMPEESSNISNVKQHCTESTESLIYSKRTKTQEVIHTLKEIIDSVKEDENADRVATKNDNDHEKNDSKIPKLLNRDTLRSNKTCTTDVNWNRAEILSPRKSVSTQTDFDIPLHHKIDTEKEKDSMEILKLTQSVATQTSPSYNRNAVEIGCNTSNVVCNDVGVSCNFIDPINLKTEVDPITIENESSEVSSSLKHIKINTGSGDINKNEEHSLSERKKTLNTEMSLKLKNCSDVEILSKMTNDEAKKTMHEEACQVSLQSSKKFDNKTNTDIDKQEESTKYFNNHGASSTSVNNLFLERSRLSICEYTASCSSEEVAECLENDEETVTSELRVKDIPSDVIAAFELAAERARNLHKAFIIHRENLMSKVSEKRNEEAVDDCDEMPKQRDHQHCLEKCASFVNCGNEHNTQNEKINSEHDFSDFILRCRGIDTVEFSSCSSSSESELDYLRTSKDHDQKEDNEPEDTMSLMALMHACGLAQDEYALELLRWERNIEQKRNESFDVVSMKNHKILALPAAIKETSLMSRKNLLPLICCIVCTVVFWFLQFSFQCNVTK